MSHSNLDKELQQKVIIAAATRVFMRSGFAGTTMDQVASEAGVVKQTVYNHFPSKDWLFKAMIDNNNEDLRSTIPVSLLPESDVRECLLAFSRQFLKIIVKPTSLGLHRMLISEAPRFPDLAKLVFSTGASRIARLLADYFRKQTKEKRICVADAPLAAEQFLGSLRGNIQLRLLLMAEGPPSEEQIDKMAETAVDNFIRAHRPRRSTRESK